jgi:hypothetical protein
MVVGFEVSCWKGDGQVYTSASADKATAQATTVGTTTQVSYMSIGYNIHHLL